MRNIEPLWSFVKRMNIGNRQIIKGMNKWMKPIPSLHESQIQSLAYHQSSPQSIRSLMANIKSFATDIKLNSDELKEIEIEAGSFRDPAGKIFYYENKVYRILNDEGKKRFQFLEKNELLKI